MIEEFVRSGDLRLGDGSEGTESLEIILENSRDPVLIVDTRGGIVDTNTAFCSAFGYARSRMIGGSIFDFAVGEGSAELRSKLVRISDGSIARGLPGEPLEIACIRGDGSPATTHCFLAGGGGSERAIVLFREELPSAPVLPLNDEEERSISDSITEAIFRLDEEFTIVFANSGVKSTFGFDRAEVTGDKLNRLFPDGIYRKHEPEFRKYFYIDDPDRDTFGLKRTIEILGVTKNRGVTPMEMSFGNSRDIRGRTLTCIVRDISHRKRRERRLRHLAFHDKLTGLGNRDLFREDLRAALREPDWETGRKAAILFLDLDGFKAVNDEFGHAAGDRLLVDVARRLRTCLRDSDIAYRFGGDEFVSFLPRVAGSHDAIAVAERALRALKDSYDLSPEGTVDGPKVGLSASVGVALMPEHGESAEAATRSADLAMYHSKEAGKNRVTLYDLSFAGSAQGEAGLGEDLRGALERGELDLHYQPIVSPEGKILGLEALVRWIRGGEPVLAPRAFIPIAEGNGTMPSLGSWIFHRAFGDFKRLIGRGFEDLFLSVNVSGRQFEKPDFAQALAESIGAAGLDPTRLTLELTEETLMADAEDSVAKIKTIRKLFPSLRFAIDDFGTGFSSMACLSRLAVDSLKIDASFVSALPGDQESKVIESILKLAECLGAEVVAEGVETQGQRSYFVDKRCYGMQGKLFMDPAPMDEILLRLAEMRAAC